MSCTLGFNDSNGILNFGSGLLFRYFNLSDRMFSINLFISLHKSTIDIFYSQETNYSLL